MGLYPSVLFICFNFLYNLTIIYRETINGHDITVETMYVSRWFCPVLAPPDIEDEVLFLSPSSTWLEFVPTLMILCIVYGTDRIVLTSSEIKVINLHSCFVRGV